MPFKRIYERHLRVDRQIDWDIRKILSMNNSSHLSEIRYSKKALLIITNRKEYIILLSPTANNSGTIDSQKLRKLRS